MISKKAIDGRARHNTLDTFSLAQLLQINDDKH